MIYWNNWIYTIFKPSQNTKLTNCHLKVNEQSKISVLLSILSFFDVTFPELFFFFSANVGPGFNHYIIEDFFEAFRRNAYLRTGLLIVALIKINFYQRLRKYHHDRDFSFL